MKFRKSGSLLTIFGVMFALSGFAGTAIAASPVAAAASVDPVAAMNVSAMALTVAVAVLLLSIVAEVWRATPADRHAPVRIRPRRAQARRG